MVLFRAIYVRRSRRVDAKEQRREGMKPRSPKQFPKGREEGLRDIFCEVLIMLYNYMLNQ